MTIALLATGNEIVEGDILNTNCRDLAHILHSEGLAPTMHLSTSDNESEIHDGLQYLAARHDTIITIGGLGPTSDDRTRFALGHYLNVPLVDFPEATNHIQKLLRNSPLASTEGNKQQTLFPANATLMPNPYGTAMGCYCKQDDKTIFMLPGPPRECLPMFHHYVMPELGRATSHTNPWIKWRLFGVAESEIGQKMDDALRHMHCETGYRLETPYVEFKVRCDSCDRAEVMRIIEPLVAPHIIASTEKKASEALIEEIAKKQKNIRIIDEVTGGVLETLLLKPETWGRLSFSGSEKRMDEVDYIFHMTGLQEYWLQAEGTSTSLCIHFESNKNRGNKAIEEDETHTIPFRSALVVQYAAEWLSFRMLELLSK
jgi:nicotinamide-nucleotide amidase